jgi:hypothetical protein
LIGNLPTLVPPNFCTSHLAEGSSVFWCRLGGVFGRENGVSESEDDERGDEAPDMVVMTEEKFRTA